MKETECVSFYLICDAYGCVIFYFFSFVHENHSNSMEFSFSSRFKMVSVNCVRVGSIWHACGCQDPNISIINDNDIKIHNTQTVSRRK